MKEISKLLSKVLRHQPQLIGIRLDSHGWVDVDTLLNQLRINKIFLSFDELQEIVDSNDKQRFIFNSDLTRIKAQQGHSVNVELELLPEFPPEILYHGTAEQFVDVIMKEGLKKMKRHHVHLSQTIETATKVGSRRGKPKILKIKSLDMHNDGYLFFKTNNNVWLTDNVPLKYIEL